VTEGSADAAEVFADFEQLLAGLRFADDARVSGHPASTIR
jgi:hypothetical protein